MNLTAEKVHKIFFDCLLNTEGLPDGFKKVTKDYPPDPWMTNDIVFVRGVLGQLIFFDRGRLEQHRREIELMLLDLPKEAMLTDKSGGCSFIQCCMDRNDSQWGEHQNLDYLLALGRAVGLVKWRLPRELWSKLCPGGVPMLVVLDDVIEK